MAKLVKIAVYIVYVIIVALVLSEVSLRILGFYSVSKEELIEYNEILGWSFISNKTAINTELEWKVDYRINEDGLRERSNIKKKTDNLYRILILGDSFTEGVGIRQNKRFSYLTETLCNEKSSGKIEVINGGVRGYNLTQYYILFRTLYKKYEPNLVIIAADGGDLDVMSDCTWFGAVKYYRPYYNLENGHLVLKGIPVPEPDRHMCKNDKLEVFKKYLRYSILYCFLRTVSSRNVFLKKTFELLHLKKDPTSVL